MDGMNIVAGDLESLAQSSACVAEDIVAKKVEAAFGDASSAMPGSESSKLISETGDSVDKRIKELSDRYTDFTEKVKASLHEYQQNEGTIQGAMGSVGSSSPTMSGAEGAAAGAAAGAVGHSYGGAAAGAAAGAAGHSYGTTTNGSTDGFLGYGSPGGGDPGVSGESDMSFNHYGIPGKRFSQPLPDSGLLGGSDGPVVEPIPTSPGDHSIDPIPNADSSGPAVENLSATNEGMV